MWPFLWQQRHLPRITLWSWEVFLDAGVTWQPLGGIPEVITQDVKYQSGSGLYSVTGVFLNKPAVAVSASASTNFSVIEV